MSVFSRNLKITNLIHIERVFVNTCKNALPRRSPSEQMDEFADAQTLELEKSLLTFYKGQAQKPHPPRPAVSRAGSNTFPAACRLLAWLESTLETRADITSQNGTVSFQLLPLSSASRRFST